MDQRPATLDEVIDYLCQHRESYPHHGKWHLELRDRIVALPPSVLTHDDHDQVVILAGIQAR